MNINFSYFFISVNWFFHLIDNLYQYPIPLIYIYINSLRLSVNLSDGGFGGWGRERPVKQRATGVSL